MKFGLLVVSPLSYCKIGDTFEFKIRRFTFFLTIWHLKVIKTELGEDWMERKKSLSKEGVWGEYWVGVRLLRSNRGVSDCPTSETKEGGGAEGRTLTLPPWAYKDVRNNEGWEGDKKKEKEGPCEANLSEVFTRAWWSRKLTHSHLDTFYRRLLWRVFGPLLLMQVPSYCLYFFYILSQSYHKRHCLYWDLMWQTNTE